MIRGAHDGAISAAEWVPGQPVLITSGEDNSVKVCLQFRPLYAIAQLRILSNGCSTLPLPLHDCSNSERAITLHRMSFDTTVKTENSY